MKRVILSSLLLVLSACGSQNSNFAPNTLSNSTRGAIYGDEDNRQDLFDITNPQWTRLSKSTVAIFTSTSLNEVKDGVFALDPDETYGSYYKLCRDERFFNQPSGAYCSGTLITDTLVLTAGHCFKDKEDCGEARFLFDYKYDRKSQNLSEFPQDKVYSCKRVVTLNRSEKRGLIDYAIIELDRPVKDRQPIPLPKKCDVSIGTKVTAIGFPSGLPMKVISSAEVIGLNDIRMNTNLDTFSGASGAPVFNTETGELLGLLANGARDFITDNRDGCQRTNRCLNGTCMGESVLRVDQIQF